MCQLVRFRICVSTDNDLTAIRQGRLHITQLQNKSHFPIFGRFRCLNYVFNRDNQVGYPCYPYGEQLIANFNVL